MPTRIDALRKLALHFIVPAALVVAGLSASSTAQAQVSVRGGVDITINQPGVYGRVVLGGGLPPPPLVFPQPVIVHPAPVAVHAQPVYLYVPPGHARHWSRHCHRYQACNQRVYFVRDEWVRERYATSHRHQHVGHGHKPPPVYHGHGGRDGHDGHRGRGRGHGHDNGHGHGHDNGHGRGHDRG